VEAIGWLAGAAAALFALDRALLAAERRGWVYWRRRGPTPGAAGTALLEVQAIFEPDRQHVVEEIRRQGADIDHAADDEPLDQPRGGHHRGGGDGDPPTAGAAGTADTDA
jgi:hypothetical protein